MAQTLGEYRVGKDFNPSGDSNVTSLKRLGADLIDLVDQLEDRGDGEFKRLKALAMTEIESACHWAVKVATKKPRDA